MADWTLDLGKIGYTYGFDYSAGTTYPEMTIVKYDGKIWATEEPINTGEIPGLTTKWKLWVDNSSITYPVDSIIASDSNGGIHAIPNAEGMLTYNNITGFNYLPVPTVGETKITLLPSSNYNNYGLSFVTNKGDVKAAGYWNSTVIHNAIGINTPTFANVAFSGAYTGTIVEMIVTYYNRYVLTSTGEVWSMGANNVGQTGHPVADGTSIKFMTKLPITNVVSIAVAGADAGTSYASFMAVDNNGILYGAGYSGYGQLGISTSNITTGIKPIPGVTNAKSVWGGTTHRYSSFAYLSDEASDNIYTAGYNAHGQLGLGNNSAKSVFTKCITETGDPMPKVKKVIFSGAYSSYGSMILLTVTGNVFTTGAGAHGSGGWGTTANKNKLYKFPYSGYIDITAVDSYAGSKLLLRGDGKVDFCGYNGYGLTGMTVPNTNLITLVGPQSVNIVKIMTNSNYNQHVAYFLNSAGEVFHTGGRNNNSTGGATAQPNVPTKIPIPEPIVDMHLGGKASSVSAIFITATGAAYVLGYNGHGELGLGVIVGSIPRVTKIDL